MISWTRDNARLCIVNPIKTSCQCQGPKGGKIGLDQFIQSNLNVEISEPLISEYRLGYNKIFSQCLFEDSTCSLFEYLKKNRISGQTLFNDIQGIKYDLNFYHN